MIKYLHFILVILQLLLLKVRVAPAQEIAEVTHARSDYQMMLMRFQVYMEYYPMSEDVLNIYSEAQQFVETEDYESAVILMEEALVLLVTAKNNSAGTITKTSAANSDYSNLNQPFKIGVLSGLDFNRQEFEVGYLENDSTIAEEFNKPYVGFTAGYFTRYGDQGLLEINNSFRYDKENIRDDYRIRWQPWSNAMLQYTGYLNQGQKSGSLSYWEHSLTARMSDQAGSSFFWTVYEFLNYKTFQSGNFILGDFYHNRFSALAEWRTSLLGISGIEYANELNETLGQENNDYIQHNIRLGSRTDQSERFYYSIYLNGILRNYAILLADSMIYNSYRGLSAEFAYEVTVWPDWRVVLEENFLRKTYQTKSSIEPDYYWNLLRPGFKINLSGTLELGIGYEWEIKKHQVDPGDSYNASEQNFDADGLFVQLNFFSLSGAYLSTSISYQWRRYPNSLTNEIFSLYSNRNVFSAILLAYIPLSPKLMLNMFFTYDNDDDIDYDQQNNQSTIFTVELEYDF